MVDRVLGQLSLADGLAVSDETVFDRIAREGALAPDASAHVPLTRPSHVTLFTGLLPAAHGIRDNVSPALDAAVPTLAETLHAAGFRTGVFVSSIVLSRQSGSTRTPTRSTRARTTRAS